MSQKQQVGVQPSPSRHPSHLMDKEMQIKSEHTQEYHKILPPKAISRPDLQNLLFRNGRVRLGGQISEEELVVEFYLSSPSCRVVTLKVTWASFTFLVNVCVEGIHSPSHNFKNKSNNQQTNIFFVPKTEPMEAIKCYTVLQWEQTMEVFGRAIKEYCFYRIASALGVDPKVTAIAGFDIVIYSKCVQFSLEQCQEIGRGSLKQSDSSIQKLKDKLRLLHSLRIVHLDIKPANIMFSRLRQELVFIDFGFSKLIKEQVGFKSRTKFYGTLHYCSHEMQKALYSDAAYSYIDLYFNDAHALQASIDNILRNEVISITTISQPLSFEEQIIHFSSNDYSPRSCWQNPTHYYEILRVKFAIFARGSSVLPDKRYREVLAKHPGQFLQFIEQFSYSRSWLGIYSLLLRWSPKHQVPDGVQARTSIQAKREKVFQKLSPQSGEHSNIFLEKLAIDSKVSEVITDDITLVIRQNYKEKLLKEASARKIPPHQYSKKFTKIIDLRASYSTFPEKTLMASILLKIKQQPRLRPTTIKTRYTQLESSLRTLLMLYMECPQQHFQFIIPCAIINLIILEALTNQELVDVFAGLKKMKACPYKMAIMLFRAHLALDWIQNKAASSYHTLKPQAVIATPVLEKIVQLESNGIKLFGSIIENFLLSELNVIKLSEQYCRESMFYVRTLKEVDEQVYEELVCLSVYQLQKKRANLALVNQMNVLLDLYDIRSRNFPDSQSIHYIQLRIFNSLNISKKIHIPILSQILSVLKNCLQEDEIISSFKVFFCLEVIHSERSRQDNLKALLDLCQLQKYRYCYSALFELYNLIIKKQSISEAMLERIRTIYCREYLQRIVFPVNSYHNNIYHFYQKVLIIFHIFYALYCPPAQQLESLSKFRVQLRIYCDDIICQNCQNLCIRILTDIQVITCLMESRIQEALHICLGQLLRLKTLQMSHTDIESATLLLRTVILILHKDKRDKTNLFVEYHRIVYQLIKETNLFHIIFICQSGWSVYLFVSVFTIQSISYEEYLRFHLRLLDFIQSYPCRDFIKIYDTCLNSFITLNIKNIGSAAEPLITSLLASRTSLNPYICLIITQLLKLIPRNSFFEKALLSICTFVSLVTAEARNISLQYLFTLIFIERSILKGKRELQYKIKKYFRFLKHNISQPSFLRKIIPTSPKKAFGCYFGKKLKQKIDQFYRIG